jgi:hypothetical protein
MVWPTVIPSEARNLLSWFPANRGRSLVAALLGMTAWKLAAL